MNKTKLMLALLAGLALGACSGSDDDGAATSPATNQSSYTETQVQSAPEWRVDWSFNQGRPDWVAPDASNYENWTVMMVELEDELKRTATAADLMAVFVGGEVRALASPAVSLDADALNHRPVLFLMKVFANEPDEAVVGVTIRYYSDSLKHVFTRSSQVHYNSEEVVGVDEELIPQFTLGSAKYPVVSGLQLAASPLAKAGITPAKGDLAAVFVGDECRGTLTVGDKLLGPDVYMQVFGRQAGESYTLKYYSTATGKVLTFSPITVEK